MFFQQVSLSNLALLTKFDGLYSKRLPALSYATGTFSTLCNKISIEQYGAEEKYM